MPHVRHEAFVRTRRERVIAELTDTTDVEQFREIVAKHRYQDRMFLSDFRLIVAEELRRARPEGLHPLLMKYDLPMCWEPHEWILDAVRFKPARLLGEHICIQAGVDGFNIIRKPVDTFSIPESVTCFRPAIAALTDEIMNFYRDRRDDLRLLRTIGL